MAFNLKLRWYQQALFDDCQKLIKSGASKICVQALTGLGKTVLFVFMAMRAKKKGNKVLVLVHRQELLTQTLKTLWNLAGLNAGQIAADRISTITNPIQVAMVQTLVRRLDKIRWTPDLIITDEVHHGVSNTYKKIYDYYEKKGVKFVHIGFTATPRRSDGKGLNDIFDHLVQSIDMVTAIKEGFLCEPVIFSNNLLQKKQYKIKRGDFDKAEQEIDMRKMRVVGDTIRDYHRYLNGLPCLCFCISIAHSEYMAKQFCANGIKAKSVSSNTPKDERKKILDGLATGEVEIVCNCDLVTEGVDIPVIAGVIILRKTLSLTIWLQIIGRALRPAKGKIAAIILDQVGNIYIHGHPMNGYEWSLKGVKQTAKAEKEIKIITCSGCYSAHPAGTIRCPLCDTILGKAMEKGEESFRKIEYIDADLHVVESNFSGISSEKFSEKIKSFFPEEARKEIFEKKIRELVDAGREHGVTTPHLKERIDYLASCAGLNDDRFLQKIYRETMGKRAS